MQRRHSRKRDNIKAVLKAQSGALSATAIRAALPHLDLTTIYRNLDIFVTDGTIKKLNLDSGEALYEFQIHPHHHAVCTSCNRILHFIAPDEKLKKLLGLENFSITEFEITVRGTCHHETSRQ